MGLAPGKVNAGLIIRTAIIVLFFLFRGVRLPIEADGSGVGAAYSIATVGLGAGLLLMGAARLFLQPFVRQERFQLPFYFVYLYLLTLLFGISLLADYFFRDAAGSAAAFFEFLASMALVHLFFVNFANPREIRWLFGGIILAGVIASSYAVTLFFLGLIGPLARVGTYGATGATYNTVGYFLVAALGVGPAAAVIVGRRSSFVHSDIVVVLLTLLLVAGIFLTSTKGAMVALVLLGALAWATGRARGARISALGRKSLMAILALAVVFLVVGESLPIQRAVQSLRPEILFRRFDMWAQAVSDIVSETWAPLIGIGLGKFSFQGAHVLQTYPHNLFLDIAVNAGVPAAVLVAVLLWKGWSLVFRIAGGSNSSPELQHLAVQLLCLGVAALAGGLVSFKYSSNFLLWIFLGVAGRLELLHRRLGQVNQAVSP